MSDITNQLIERVKLAADNKQALVIQGAGTKTHLGRAPSAEAEVISVREHSGIIHYEPVELVMTVRAGTSLADIDAALAEHQQMLACDPARFKGEATIAGSLASNQAGPARPWAGSLRDHVLGVNLINGCGEHLRFGGKVMKNVAGYDVSRLQAGAMGTLGLITEISVKVLPKPAASLTLSHTVDMEEAIRLMNVLAGQPKPLTGACWVDGKVYLRLSGAKSAVEGTAEKWQGEVMATTRAEEFWSGLREQQLTFFSDRDQCEPLWRFSINAAAPVFLHDRPWLFDWAGAQRWLRGEHVHADLQQWATTHGGEVLRYRGGDRAQDVFYQDNPVLRKIQQQLKRSFDPNNIFNVGRLYSWL
jgi:glycolate oxidase FAD binding subunit